MNLLWHRLQRSLIHSTLLDLPKFLLQEGLLSSFLHVPGLRIDEPCEISTHLDANCIMLYSVHLWTKSSTRMPLRASLKKTKVNKQLASPPHAKLKPVAASLRIPPHHKDARQKLRMPAADPMRELHVVSSMYHHSLELVKRLGMVLQFYVFKYIRITSNAIKC